MTNEIVKIGAVLLDGRGKLLVVEKDDRGVFIIPGGRQEFGESDAETIERELREELAISASMAEKLGELTEPAAFEDALVNMRVYLAHWSGIPTPSSEITALQWVDRSSELPMGSALVNHVIPWLGDRGLIDG